MPSELLTALYNQRADEAAALASRLPRLDVFEAAAMGDAARLRELLTADPACARAWSDDGFTPLHLAAFFAHPECVRTLIEAGADADACSQNAMSVQPLHGAVASRSLRCVELLLEVGSDPNARQAGGYTPLHEAVHNGNRAIEAALLAAGADPSLTPDVT
ncbi:MAG TPA: ankyrin repeat domain-containing protein [Candidatus Cybelea sp.]